LKLLRRGHVIPKALHANMFLVRRAKEVMDADIVVVPGDMSFDAFLALPDHRGRLRHVVITEGNRVVGVLRVNTALRRLPESAQTGIRMREIASRDFTLVREDDIVFDVLQRMWRKRSLMALVLRGKGVPRPGSLAGVITKEHVADSVASSVRIYPA